MSERDARIGEILLKGDARGVRLVIPEELAPERLKESLKTVLGTARRILAGARVVIDLQGRTCAGGELLDILEHFVWPGGVTVASWISYHAETLRLLRASGFPTGEPPLPGPASAKGRPPLLLLPRSLRSGQRVEHGADVVVAGHVNDGAEIFAVGCVVIWGRLQGLVHAGCAGDHGAQILVRSFEAPQVRIGSKVSYVDKDASWWGKPLVLFLENEAFVVHQVETKNP